MKVVRLSALRTGRLYPPGNIPGTHFCYKLSQPQGRSATGRIMSMKTSNAIIRNGTRDLPACSAVSQSAVPPRTPQFEKVISNWSQTSLIEEQRSTIFCLNILFSFKALGSNFQRCNEINKHVYSGFKCIRTLKILRHI